MILRTDEGTAMAARFTALRADRIGSGLLPCTCFGNIGRGADHEDICCMQACNLIVVQHTESETGHRRTRSDQCLQLRFEVFTPFSRQRQAVPTERLPYRPQQLRRMCNFIGGGLRHGLHKQVDRKRPCCQRPDFFCLFNDRHRRQQRCCQRTECAGIRYRRHQ